MSYVPSYIIKRELYIKGSGTVVETLTTDNTYVIATNNALMFNNVREAKTYYNTFLGNSKGLHFIVGNKGGMYYAKNGKRLNGVN